MKKLVLTGLWLVLIISVATAQTFQWGHSLGLANRSRAMAIANDSNGNIYTLGIAKSSTHMIMGVYPTGDLLLEKRDSNGVVLWSKTFPGHACGLDIAVTPFSQIIITGGFYDSLYFGGNDTLKSPGLTDRMFLANFTLDGTLTWSKVDSSQWGELGISITTDGSNFYLCGVSSDVNGMLRKYNIDGTKVWEKEFPGVRNFDALVVESSGNMYVSGTCTPQAVFDDIHIPPDTADAGYISFVAKLDPSGTTQWLRANTYSTFNISSSLALDGFGYLCRVRQAKDFMSTIFEVIEPQSDSLMASWAFPASSGDYDHLITNSLTSTGSSNIFFGPYYATNYRDTTTVYQLRHGISGQGVIFFIDSLVSINGAGLRLEALSLFGESVYLSGHFYDSSLTLGSVVLLNTNDPKKFETDCFISRIAPEANTSVHPQRVNSGTLSLYPNPTTDELTISFSDAASRSIEIYTMLGILVERIPSMSSKQILDIRRLPAGVYTIVARSEDRVGRTSVIKR